jgi:hypothetical protein
MDPKRFFDENILSGKFESSILGDETPMNDETTSSRGEPTLEEPLLSQKEQEIARDFEEYAENRVVQKLATHPPYQPPTMTPSKKQ